MASLFVPSCSQELQMAKPVESRLGPSCCIVCADCGAILSLADVVRIVYSKRHKTVECPSARPSVCLSPRSTAASAAAASGFAAEVGRLYSRYRSIAAAAARHAGRVNFGPTARRSSVLVMTYRSVILVLCPIRLKAVWLRSSVTACLAVCDGSWRLWDHRTAVRV